MDDFDQDITLDSPPPPNNDRPLFRSSDDEDEDSPPARTAPTKATSKNRPARPRFLGDSDDDENVGGGGAGPSRGGKGGGTSEVDAMFEGLDWSDDEALPERTAQLNLPGISDPTALTNDPLALDADEDAGPTRKKRVVVKLDEARLTGPNGIPKLMEQVKGFKLKGKGREDGTKMEDLKRVLKMYQLWAHQMFPKTNFQETIENVEKVCRKRGMQASMREWRDECHGLSTKRPKTSDPDAEAALTAALDASEPDALLPAPKPKPSAQDDIDISFDPDAELFDDSIFDDPELDLDIALNPNPKPTIKNPPPLFAPAPDEWADGAPSPPMGFDEDFGFDEEDAEREMREAEVREEKRRRELHMRELEGLEKGNEKGNEKSDGKGGDAPPPPPGVDDAVAPTTDVASMDVTTPSVEVPTSDTPPTIKTTQPPPAPAATTEATAKPPVPGSDVQVDDVDWDDLYS